MKLVIAATLVPDTFPDALGGPQQFHVYGKPEPNADGMIRVRDIGEAVLSPTVLATPPTDSDDECFEALCKEFRCKLRHAMAAVRTGDAGKIRVGLPLGTLPTRVHVPNHKD